MSTMNFDLEDAAEDFVRHYYKVFDDDRKAVKQFYRDNSTLTFTTTPSQGAESITEKLVGLPFKEVKHRVYSTDCQTSNDEGGALVLVTGALLVNDDQQVISYTQAFQLLPDGESFYIRNDLFNITHGSQ